MGLTVLCYITAIAVIPFGTYLRYRTPIMATSRVIFMISLTMAIMAASIGITYDTASVEAGGMPLFFCRLSAVAVLGCFLALFRLSLSFPYEKKLVWLEAILTILFISVAVIIFLTDWYAVSVTKVEGIFSRAEGKYYQYITIGGASFGLFASLVLFIRRFLVKSRIYRLQLSILSLGAIGSVAFGYLTGIALPSFFDFSWLYPLSSFTGLLILLSLYFAVTITRLFDIRAITVSVLSFLAFALFSGGVFGLVSASLLYLRGNNAFLVFIGIPPLFVGSCFLFFRIRGTFFKALRGRGDYLPGLEKGLNDIDFSKGRDYVMETASNLIREAMNFTDFNILIEDIEGELQTVFSSTNSKVSVERKAAPIEHMVNMDVSILLKTEAITNHNFFSVKQGLLDIFDSMKAEALILLREGRHVIGAISLGAKKTGADFTAYDYAAFRQIYGKLFVIVFYLKNIAKESILSTVDRELQFSGQIIQSIQENIDKITHPKAEVSYISKSTRKLGGDFIDFIKLSPDRYFFVLGDVSGKGLNASMSMVILKSIIRTYLKEEKDFSKLVIKINSFIKLNLPRGIFFAGVLGIFDFAKDTLYFVNCGIPVMFMYSPQFNNVIEIQGEGRVLGFVKDYTPYLKLRKIALVPSSVLFITTDGIIEAESLRGERFGKERIQRSINEYRNYPAEKLVGLTFTALENYVAAEINDDVTIFALKY